MVNVPPSRREKKTSIKNEAIRFLLVWGAGFALLYMILSPFESLLQGVETEHVRFLLERVGVSTTAGGGVPFQFVMGNKTIEISPLCSGLVEMILLTSAIFATRGEKIGARIQGIAAGLILLYGFNLFRMVVTLLQLEYTSLSFAAATHDLLFRLLLIVGFATIYGAWLHRRKVWEWGREKGLV
ncbi:MAG: exosortase/archaeosortase family protein [archaeon]